LIVHGPARSPGDATGRGAGGEAVFLERYGKRAAVLLSPERHEELMEVFEDAEDIAAFDAAMAEEGNNIPWESVKADLGWS
jgi:hypothetical protein